MTMTVVERVLDQCRRAGVAVAVADDGEHLFLSPLERLDDDLVEVIREHKTTLLLWLKMEPKRWVMVEHDDGHVELIRSSDSDTNRLNPEENGNCVTVTTEAQPNFDDLPLLQFCPRCGGWQWWQSVAGTWRCQTCDPPTDHAERFMRRRPRSGHGIGEGRRPDERKKETRTAGDRCTCPRRDVGNLLVEQRRRDPSG